nr:glycolate oxidase subunit GlcF [uncultured Rhodopila sp.]
MQTNFTTDQLQDPDTASSNAVLRTCVHCGFCTATCPTFVLLGDELDSPRGRIYLIKDMLETGRPATEEVVRHVDRCLTCLSCMTTCPSGVNYMHLVDHARTYIAQTYRRPFAERWLRALLGLVLPRPRLFRLALKGAGLTRPLGKLVRGDSMLANRLRAMLSLAPATVPPASPVEKPRVYPAEGARKARVALMTGCAQQVLMPRINEATIRLLTRLGVEVVVAKGAGCCGALNHHNGQHDPAMALAAANIDAWSREIAGEGLDAIVINASGCGTTVKDYGFMFRNEPEPRRSRAEQISGLTLDISQFLTRFGYAPSRPAPNLTVAYHSACSLQHGQKVTAEPKTLLAKAGFRVVEPKEPHLCCGSAGTYNLLQPVIAGQLKERKLENLKATRPDLISAGNIGCITQLSGAGLPVVHTVELLDWMSGGPPPPGVPG